jgi:hypothetical protein
MGSHKKALKMANLALIEIIRDLNNSKKRHSKTGKVKIKKT